MLPFFSKSRWSLDDVAPTWGGSESIYEYLRRTPDAGSLPDEPEVRKKCKFGWVGGAWDGVFGGASGGTEANKKIFELIEAIRNLVKHSSGSTFAQLYNLLVEDSILPYIDEFLKQIEQKHNPTDKLRILEVGKYLATRAPHREAVKFGLALIGMYGTEQEKEILKTLGRNDEFTLYAALAIARVSEDPERELWEMAKGVHGWGRVQIVRRLEDTQNKEIQAWMLREGFRNQIMDEYLACICARAGKLHEALGQQFVDEELLDAATDILRALLHGSGPAEGMDDYEHGADTCESYINIVWAHEEKKIGHFLTVADLRRFLSQTDGWEKRTRTGWTEPRRREMSALCDDILARKEWKAVVMRSLGSHDQRIFFDADTAAGVLGIDTWEVHFERVKATPINSSSWYGLMRQTNENRIGQVLEFAESALPLVKIATGPKDELGMGPEFALHGTLDWLLQDLKRFPNRGWKLISAGLKSPLVRNRNMAIQALGAWTRDSWTEEIVETVKRAREEEPREDVRQRLTNLFNGRPITINRDDTNWREQ